MIEKYRNNDVSSGVNYYNKKKRQSCKKFRKIDKVTHSSMMLLGVNWWLMVEDKGRGPSYYD